MTRRKAIDLKILEASKSFDAEIFIDTIKGEFSDFPDYRSNKKRFYISSRRATAKSFGKWVRQH